MAIDIDNMLWVSSQRSATGSVSNVIYQFNTKTGEPTRTFANPSGDSGGNYDIAADSSGYLWAKNDIATVQRFDIKDNNPSGSVATTYDINGNSVISAGLSPRILRAIAGTPTFYASTVVRAISSVTPKWNNRWGKIFFDVDPEILRKEIQAQMTFVDNPDVANNSIPDANWMSIDEFNRRINTSPTITLAQYLGNKTLQGEIIGQFLKLRFRVPLETFVEIFNIRITCRDAAGSNICL